jgi:enediyne biosynthesis thioesterase
MQPFEMRHVVSFEDTNVVGNVYYVNHLRWQGRCRVVTVRCSCDYITELFAFDEIIVRMRPVSLTQSRLTMHFDYWRVKPGAEQLVAVGDQEVACMRRDGTRLQPAAWPASFAAAVERFADVEEVVS